MTNKTKLKLLSVAAAGAVFALFGLDNTLTLADYIIRSEKIKKPVNLVFLSDIHSQNFRDGGEKLIEMIDSAKPDFILFGGDVFDKYSKQKDIDRTKELVNKITGRFENCYYVLGNHEVDSKMGVDYKQLLADTKLNLFSEDIYELTSKNGQKILLGGVDYVRCDNGIPEDCKAVEYKKEFIKRKEEADLFSVFLRHVPMKTEGDEKIDLILSGHNHGGLWRFPNTNAGVAGGGKKLLPRYVHGEYKNGDSTMIVGSGITTETYLLPRLYNVPEVVSIKLLPKTNLPY